MEQNNDLDIAKEMSLGYYLTGVTILAVAALLGFIVRLSQTGALGNVPQLYYTLMTLHGMAAFVGWGCFVAMGLTWYTLVKHLDSPLHSTKLVMFIYWNFMVGVLLLVVATLFGNFGGSWVFLYPLSFYGYWENWAAFMWNLGVALAGISIILYGVEILLTIKKAGYSLLDALGFEILKPSKWKEGEKRVPLPIVPLAVIGWGMIIATLPFAYLLVYTLLEFMDLVPRMDTLLAKNMLWWFGHPVVYLILFPVVSFMYSIVMDYTGHDIIGEKWAKSAWFVATVVQNFIGAHHVYADLAQQQWVHAISEVGTYAIILPSLVSIFSITGTIYLYKFKWDVASSYVFVSLTFWLLAGMSGWVNATIALNEFVHNSLWVVAHFHTMAVLALSTLLFGMAFHIMDQYKGVYSKKMAKNALIVYVVSGVGFVHLWFIQGLWGGIRRSYRSTPESLNLFTWISLVFAFFLMFGLWMNFYNSYMSLTQSGEKVKEEVAVAAD